MQLGIRIHDTIKMPVEERLAHIRSLGFTCGHLAPAMVLGDYSVADEALTPGYAMYLKKLFAQNDLDCAVLGCYLNLANPNKEQLDKITHRYLAHIRFASLLGCGVVGTETGAPNETYTPVPECHSEEAFQTFITNLRPVVEYAEKMGVIIGIEPVYQHIVYNAKCARTMLDTIQSPNLQIILDPVNLLDISNYEKAEEIVEEAIELLGPDVAVVHIKDFKVKDGRLLSVGAGLGQMNYTSLMRFMKERKPFIHATLENTTPENHIQCKEFIQKLYDEA